MIKEAMEFLARLATSSGRAQVIDGYDAEGKLVGRKINFGLGGEKHVWDVDIAPVSSLAFSSLAGFADVVNRFDDGREILVSPTGAVTNAPFRSVQLAYMPMVNKEFTQLQVVRDYTHRELVDAWDRLGMDPSEIQTMQIGNHETGNSLVKPGEESLGRSVTRRQESGPKLPRDFFVELEPFVDSSIADKRKIMIPTRMYLDPDQSAKPFLWGCTEYQAQQAREMCAELIASNLRSILGEDYPIYR
jgi:hypothetical protein